MFYYIRCRKIVIFDQLRVPRTKKRLKNTAIEEGEGGGSPHDDLMAAAKS
jgi:hypothetical protein